MNGFRRQFAPLLVIAGALLSIGASPIANRPNTARQPSAETQYFGLFAKGQRIGYTSSKTSQSTWNNKPAIYTDSTTVMNAELIGAALNLRLDSKTWTSPNGTPFQMRFKVASAGLTQNVEAIFEGKTVRIVVDNIGKKTTSRIPVPKTGFIIDDPLPLVASGRLKAGESTKFWVLDPMTVSFIENEVKYRGKVKISTEAGEVTADFVEIIDPRVSTKVYLSSKGDLIRAESALGIEIRSLPKNDALAKPTGLAVDLADVTRVPVPDPIEDARNLKLLTLDVEGGDMNLVKSDEHQSVSKLGEGWRVSIHPVDMVVGATVSKATESDKKSWLNASLHIPATSPKFRALARKITGGTNDLAKATRSIHQYVHTNMKTNAGMGVLRNADQVLGSMEGVCRDHAILTTTLFRAANIPARLVGGMIYSEGAFYYHAWTEIWDGSQWVGVDTTLPEMPISAVHLKLASGNVDKAFSFKFLADTKIKVAKTLSR
ncbi:Transglutaminase-like [Fimbriimonadaceae bacterium]